ncbi:HAMP domain-containing sensor histidine kinase [Actinoplanes missouriensis]|uniref:sensor histidine kinase n=1 Tax=Actinoplanes missouriensis TaxID=1866 RepID=UPI0033FF7FB0
MRSALTAGVVVAVASVLAGGILLITARSLLLADIQDAADDRSDQVTAAVASGDPTALRFALREDSWGSLVQIIGADGTVTARRATSRTPLTALRPAVGATAYEESGGYWIQASGVRAPAGERTVLVAVSLEFVRYGSNAILTALLVGLPILAAAVGVAVFFFVGRTLRPVEAMRGRAASITATSLHARLPVPIAEDEIAALARTMNTMLERIERSASAQRRFVADASHELRSPLTTIHANADLLAAANLGETPARAVRRIHDESRRMARLVDDLLLLARSDDQELLVRRDDVDLDDLLYAARERIVVERPDLLVEGAIDPVRVTGDPDRLARLLRNLTDNTLRYARSTVTLSLTAGDGVAEIVVGNDGPPIAAEDRERVFGRFIRLDDSRSRESGGTGLGLAIAREIVEAHGGSIDVLDLRQGAALRVRLPTAGGSGAQRARGHAGTDLS